MATEAAAGGTPGPGADSRKAEVLCEQVRLLYAGANVASGVTVVAATILSWLQWDVVPKRVVLSWWAYSCLVAISRWLLALQFKRVSPGQSEIGKWQAAFAAGAGLAGTGWGGAAVFLYPPDALSHQVFLAFVLGGMMLGAASLLAPRPEAFLAFLLPSGFSPAVRFFLQGDDTHVAMGVLAALFTVAIVVTTWRLYLTIDSTLRLQFTNHDLIIELKSARTQTDALNQTLEIRIQERTAALHKSAELLRAEMEQRRQMEEELLRTRKLESLGVLAGGIAHDFNNFLTVISGNIEAAMRTLSPGHAVQDMLRQAGGGCRRAASLSSQLLTFAKGGDPVRRVVPVAGLVMDSVRLAGAGAPVGISADISPDLWSARVDPGQIGQVLYNILLNARQAMPEGGRIEVRAENVESPDGPESGRRVRISIRDHGCGIPPDVLPRVFDPYFSTKPGGSGLGLATAYSIVARHDGHISITSEPGRGTSVTVELAAAWETDAAGVPAAVDAQHGSGRILVMDDEEALRKLCVTVLGGLGYHVQTARDGEEAIALYQAAMASGQGFDAVLLDLTVRGGMGGLETAARLRATDASSKLVVSSGYSDTSVMSDFAAYGFDAVIQKPWTTAQMSAVLRALLDPDPRRGSGQRIPPPRG